jgi:hypothetical protein
MNMPDRVGGRSVRAKSGGRTQPLFEYVLVLVNNQLAFGHTDFPYDWRLTNITAVEQNTSMLHVNDDATPLVISDEGLFTSAQLRPGLGQAICDLFRHWRLIFKTCLTLPRKTR